MTDKLISAAEMALEALQDYIIQTKRVNAIAALRQALDQLPDTTKMIDTGTDRGAWADVSDATKWVDELRGDDDIGESSNYNLIIHALTELHNKTPYEDGNGSALIYLDEAVNVIEKIEALDEPPKCEWVGLTEEEIAEVGKFTTEGEHMLPYSFACAIEAKLKEKNT